MKHQYSYSKIIDEIMSKIVTLDEKLINE